MSVLSSTLASSSDQAGPTAPATRHRRTLEQRLELAKLAEGRAAERLARKTRKVQQYESVQKARARKLDTRKKIIAGALALEHMQFDGRYGVAFRALIDEYVTRDQDRALFGLEPLPADDARRVSPPKVY